MPATVQGLILLWSEHVRSLGEGWKGGRGGSGSADQWKQVEAEMDIQGESQGTDPASYKAFLRTYPSGGMGLGEEL